MIALFHSLRKANRRMSSEFDTNDIVARHAGAYEYPLTSRAWLMLMQSVNHQKALLPPIGGLLFAQPNKTKGSEKTLRAPCPRLSTITHCTTQS